jgi:hypothetical protein
MAVNINAEHTSFAKLVQSSWPISLLRGVFIVKVLDRAHQVPLAVERQCRPRSSGVENLGCDPRRQRQILQSDADLGQAFATLESFEVFGMQALNCDSEVDAVVLEQPIEDREVAVKSSLADGLVVFGRRIDALILQQSFDDREVAAQSSLLNGVVIAGRWIDARVLQQSLYDREVATHSSPSDSVVVVGRRIDARVLQQAIDDREVAVLSSTLDGEVVLGRRIDALVSQQSFDDSEVAVISSHLDGTVIVGRRIEHRVSNQIIDNGDVAVLSGPHKGDVRVSVDRQLAGFEHALHIRQSPTGSVIKECLKGITCRP